MRTISVNDEDYELICRALQYAMDKTEEGADDCPFTDSEFVDLDYLLYNIKS